VTRLATWTRRALGHPRPHEARIDLSAEYRDLIHRIDRLAADEIARREAAVRELGHALWFITSRGLRPEYETASAARRRAEGERRARP
jgi:hypothetical protein